MHIFLFLLFLILGLAGLIYKVDTGVFVGFSLIPWELIKIGINRKLILAALTVCSLAGLIFFIMIKEWVLFLLFILVQFYNVWGYYRKYIMGKELDKKKD
ncbi:MAG: hypothetical protein ACOC4G_08950 [Bacillota bacterium]